MRVVKQFLAVVAVSLVGSRAVLAVQDNAGLSLILGVATAAAAIMAYGWVVRRTERREVTEL
ncbi:CPBP family intramembrane glutamate endopeptidase, partial [Micromonospora sp. NPDC005313]